MIQLQNSIINESSSWIGTKFHHQGRVKKTASHSGGCDCIGFIIGVSRNLFLKSKLNRYISDFDRIDYPRFSRNMLSPFMDEHFVEIDKNKPDICDLILFKIGRYLQHIGMIYKIHNNQRYMIHSHISVNSVSAHIIDDYWNEKIFKIYRFTELVTS